MEEDLILQQPADRRLGNANALPPGPPGVEFDAVDFDNKKAPRPVEKDSTNTGSKSSRRRSPSGSPPRSKRKSPSRNRRSPSPLDSGNRRRRRSPSPAPRRGRFRDYSPDRRRYDSGRSSRRSPDRRRGRYRYRGRSNSRSRSRSTSPRRGGGGATSGGSNRWSPKNKPSSPSTNAVSAPPPTAVATPSQVQPAAQYGVLPPQLYGGETYAQTAYNQYTVPPPQAAAFAASSDAYGMQAPAPPGFNAAYPPPPAWGVNDAYAQQSWMQSSISADSGQIQQQPATTAAAAGQVQSSSQSGTGAATATQSLNVLPDAAPGTVDPNPAHDAVAQEAENQRDELKKQRSSYLKKTALLKKELKMLKEQRRDLNSGAPPSPTTKGFIDENEKLQNQIQKKLNTIENVIDMLTGIIGEENLEREPEQDTYDGDTPQTVSKLQHGASAEHNKKKPRNSSSSSDSSSGSSSSSSESTSSSSSSENEEEDDDSSSERLKHKVMESMKSKPKKDMGNTKVKEDTAIEEKKRFNYVFYDPEMHWCQTCDIFPKTAKDYLNHLHTREHMDRESIETPWHLDMITDQYPAYENAPTKRTPIRGLTFFVPATAWFCKLCSVWMGDLHCASTHLKSQLHSNKYNAFLDQNPHFEVNWLADRQRVLNEKKAMPLPPQITSVSTTAGDSSSKKAKKDAEKSKKRKKKSSDKKDKKKKKKRSKKRKKAASSSSSTSSESSTSDSEQQKTKNKSYPVVIKDLDNPNPAASIRVAMRKQETTRADDDDVPPPAPRFREEAAAMGTGAATALTTATNGGRLGRWTEAQASAKASGTPAANEMTEDDNKHDDVIIQQWNTVQPVISESEKKLLEQLKGKLKNKPREETTAATSARSTVASDTADTGKENRNRQRGTSPRRREDDGDRIRDRDRERQRDRDRDRDRRRRSRSPLFGGRGGVVTASRRGRRSRTRSRSRGRNSPIGRRRRSRSRSLRRRSRSYERRRRYSRSRTHSRTRSRTRSTSRSRVEKPIVRHSEFRPRVPEKEKEKEKKASSDAKDKKDAQKKSKSSTSSAAAANSSGKKLPFIGKMPVFKKQTSGQTDGGNGSDKRPDESDICHSTMSAVVPTTATFATPVAPHRPPAPTAAQIQMAMMEDVYGNAPPFHPDAGMMVDYDDLMPDPVQFVNLMGQAPPPPPPAATETGDGAAEVGADDADILPPGIDEMESEEFVPKPISEGPLSREGPLPEDLQEALNIIFPGEKKEADNEEASKKAKAPAGETQIIVEEPVMQPEDLVKEGIHLVTIEETSMAGLDEASQLSMNEPLVFNKPVATPSPTMAAVVLEDASSQNAADIDLSAIKPPPATVAAMPPTAVSSNGSPSGDEKTAAFAFTEDEPVIVPAPDDIPMPAAPEEDAAAIMYDLDDIPQPPASPTESEKNRRQEELNDLAMLGIDADDMAAQCI